MTRRPGSLSSTDAEDGAAEASNSFSERLAADGKFSGQVASGRADYGWASRNGHRLTPLSPIFTADGQRELCLIRTDDQHADPKDLGGTQYGTIVVEGQIRSHGGVLEIYIFASRVTSSVPGALVILQGLESALNQAGQLNLQLVRIGGPLINPRLAGFLTNIAERYPGASSFGIERVGLPRIFVEIPVPGR
jgi:hypothetical protein